MFGMSFGELIVIFVVILLVFGPDKLPHVASKLGKITGELKRTSDSLRREFYNSAYTPAQELDALKQDFKGLVASSVIETPKDCPQEPLVKEKISEPSGELKSEPEPTINDSDQRKD